MAGTAHKSASVPIAVRVKFSFAFISSSVFFDVHRHKRLPEIILAKNLTACLYIPIFFDIFPRTGELCHDR